MYHASAICVRYVHVCTCASKNVWCINRWRVARLPFVLAPPPQKDSLGRSSLDVFHGGRVGTNGSPAT